MAATVFAAALGGLCLLVGLGWGAGLVVAAIVWVLIGVGVSMLGEASGEDPIDLADPGFGRRAKAERAMDQVRNRFGGAAIVKGRGLPAGPAEG